MKIDDSAYIYNSLISSAYNSVQDEEKEFLLKFYPNLLNSKQVMNYKANLDNKITQIISFEKPDLLIISSDVIYAIEHFRVDDSQVNRNGSKYKKQYTKKYWENNNKDLHNLLKTGNIPFKYEDIIIPLCYQNLYDNVIKNFENHYSKIDDYKDNIKSKLNLKDKEIKFFFFIQDDSLFSSFIFDNNRTLKYVLPYNDILFIEYCKNKQKLEGVFYDHDSTSKQFVLIDNKNLNKYQIDGVTTYDFTKTKTINCGSKIAVLSGLTLKLKSIRLLEEIKKMK